MRRIEFLGLPGSGKSALRDSLVLRRYREGLPVASLSDALYLALRVRAGHASPTLLVPRRSAGLLERKWRRPRLLRSMDPSIPLVALADFMTDQSEFAAIAVQTVNQCEISQEERVSLLGQMFMFWANRRIIEQHVDARYEIVFDEGFALRAAAAFARHRQSNDVALVREYLACMPLPDALVVLEVDPEICLQRATQRKSGMPKWLRSSSLADRRHAFSRFAECIEMIVSELSTKDLPIVRVDNSQVLDDAVADADALLNQTSLACDHVVKATA